MVRRRGTRFSIGSNTNLRNARVGSLSQTPGGGIDPDLLIFDVQSDNAGTSNDDQFTLPLRPGYSNDFILKADGLIIPHNTDSSLTITFPSGPGMYRITIEGVFAGFYFNNGGDKLKMLPIVQWGTGAYSTMTRAFFGCLNWDITATDIPNTAAVATFLNLATGSGVTNLDMEGWDTGNNVSLSRALRYCVNLIALSMAGTDASKVTTMVGMCDGDIRLETADFNGMNAEEVTVANQVLRACASLTTVDVTGLNLIKAYIISEFFSGCISLTALDLTNFIKPSVTTALKLCYNCTSLASIILTGCDTSNIVSMAQWFYNCGLLDPDVSGLNIGSLISAAGMMEGSGFSRVNYDKLLIAWQGQPHQIAAVPLHAGTAQYSSGAAETARSALIADGWIITDGGIATETRTTTGGDTRTTTSGDTRVTV